MASERQLFWSQLALGPFSLHFLVSQWPLTAPNRSSSALKLTNHDGKLFGSDKLIKLHGERSYCHAFPPDNQQTQSKQWFWGAKCDFCTLFVILYVVEAPCDVCIDFDIFGLTFLWHSLIDSFWHGGVKRSWIPKTQELVDLNPVKVQIFPIT